MNRFIGPGKEEPFPKKEGVHRASPMRGSGPSREGVRRLSRFLFITGTWEGYTNS